MDDFFSIKEDTSKCHCAANDQAIFKWTYDEIFYANTKNPPIDVLFLLEHKEQPFLMKWFAHQAAYLGEGTTWCMRVALGCTPKGYSSKDTVGTYQACKKHNIKKIIQEMKPKAIVTTGRALYTITETKDIRPEHCYALHEDDTWIWSNEFNCRVYPVPALYTWVQGRNKLDNFEWFFTKEQIKRTGKYVTDKRAFLPVRSLKPQFKFVEDPNEFLERLIQDDKITEISMDIETSNLDWINGKLHNISLSYDGVTGYFLLFDKTDKDVLKRLFATSKKFIFHNGNFDLKFLIKRGISNARCDFDTILASYILNENRRHKLKNLAWFYTKHGGYEARLKEYLKTMKKKSFVDLPEEMLLEYACYDAIVTFQLFKYFEKRLKEEDEDVRRYFYEVQMEAMPMLIDVEMTGIGVDLDYMKEYNSDLVKKKTEIEEKIYEIAGSRFNLGSQKQLSIALRSIKGFKPLKDEDGNELVGKAGYLKTSKGIMEKYAEQGFPLALQIKEFNHIKKEISQLGIEATAARDEDEERTLFDDIPEAEELFEKDEELPEDGMLGSIDNGRLYGGFLQYGTETGRLSGKGGLRTSVNFQNFQKKEPFRRVFKPNDGFIFVAADYEGMEVVQSSQLAGPGALEDIILTGKDMHCYTGVRLAAFRGLHVSYDEFVTKSKIEKDPIFKQIRDDSKGVNFLCCDGDTEIRTNQGVFKLRELVPMIAGYSKWANESLKVENRHKSFSEISHSLYKPDSELLDIELEDGSTISVTPDHQMLVIRNSVVQKISAEELVEDDELLSVNYDPLYSTFARTEEKKILN